MNIGIIGYGIIGSALGKWLEANNPNCKIFISDPAKGFNDDLSECDAIFISIHIPTEEDGLQDLTLLKQIIKSLPDKPIFIRTTLLPGSCDQLSKEFNKKIYFMPEFLQEKTAYEDFCNQPMILTGEIELLQKIFFGKKFITMLSKEAEITKYAHNVFGALKVTYFNGIYDLCEKMDCDYTNVQKGILASGYINSMWSSVPGHDKKFGYGGKCFPKDVEAFIKVTMSFPLENLILNIKKLNKIFRTKSKTTKTL